MAVVWGAAAILERFFGSMHIARRQNIEENGRIVIDKGRNEIVFPHPWHYNDISKANQLFAGGGVDQWRRKDTGQFVAAVPPKQ